MDRRIYGADDKGIKFAEGFMRDYLGADNSGNSVDYKFETIEGTDERFDFYVTATTEQRE